MRLHNTCCWTDQNLSAKRTIDDFSQPNTVEIGYNFTGGTEYFVSIYMSVVITEDNVMVDSEEITGTTGYLTV